jgi:hypothetical protein
MTSKLETLDPKHDAVQGANDAGRMTAALDAWFERAGRDERVATLAIERIFYLPGQDFSAVYRVVLARGREREEALLFGSIRYEGDAAHWLAKAERKAAKGKYVVPRLGAAVYHLPELDLVLWTFPNDPKLKVLGAALDPAAVRTTLAGFGGPDGGGAHWVLGAVEQTLVRYIPRKRCVFRCAIEWRQERAADGSPRGFPATMLQHVYAKVYDDGAAGEAAFAVLQAMSAAAQADTRWLRVPAALHYDVERQTLWQAAVPGHHLAASAAEVSPALAAVVGRGLAMLQQAQLPLDARMSLDLELEKMHQQAHLMVRVHPEFGPAVHALQTQLDAALPALPRLPLVPAHGTFKLNHLLFDGRHASLVDFDSMVLADPLYDVANFIADLHYLEAQGGLPAGRALPLGRAFYEAWNAAVPWGKRDAVLDWYVASLLVRKQAMKCVKHLHANARAKMDTVLREAAYRLEKRGR